MAIAKVILNGNTLIDTTDKTVASSNLLYPNTALGANGEAVTGEVVLGNPIIDTNYLPNQNTTIEDGWIGTQIFKELTDTITDETQITYSTARSNLEQCFFSSFTGNTHYKVYGQFELKWANNDTEIYTININDWNYNKSLGSYCDIPFTWSGSGRSQTFNRMSLLLSSGQYIGVYLYTSNSITDTVTWTSNNYLSLYTIDYNVYESVTINLSDNPKFLPIYKSLAYRSIIASSTPGVSEWCNSLSRITSQQFAGQYLSGDFIFSNVSFVGQYAFAWNYTGGFTGNITTYNLTFPILSSFYDNSPFAMNRGLISIYCPSMTTIGSYTFYNCFSLTTISFPECTSIGNYAFQWCSKLSIISFPKCISIGSYAFQNCSNLTTVSFLECVSISGYAFYNCSKLTSIYFPKCTTISSNAFYSCSKLTAVSFPECTSIRSSAFQYCSNLTTISFPECTTIGANAFYYCSSLTTVSFPECVSIDYNAFYNCYSLTTISFPKCSYINYSAFYQCSSLTSAYFPECSIMSSNTFRNCSNLTIVSFPKCTSIGTNTFQNCSKLESAYFMGSSIISLGANVFYNTPISISSYLGYYGSIYVPTSLLASYKTATNWAAYSARMVGI